MPGLEPQPGGPSAPLGGAGAPGDDGGSGQRSRIAVPWERSIAVVAVVAAAAADCGCDDAVGGCGGGGDGWLRRESRRTAEGERTNERTCVGQEGGMH